MTISYEDFLSWALIKESSLKLPIDMDDNPKISEYSNQLLYEGYNDALNRCVGIKHYLRLYNYRDCVYNYALHIAIVSAAFQIKLDDEGNIWNEPTEALQKLYVQYKVYDSTLGIATSVSSGGSSSSQSLPRSLTEGDLETSYLMSTPYGIQVEMYFENLNGVVI